MKWKGVVATALAVAATAVPAAGAGGATQTVDTWSHVSGDTFYNGEGICNSSTIVGILVDGSGIARITETDNGGAFVRGYSDDTWALYNASGPPWDVTLGSFYGTMTVHATFEELVPANGQMILGSSTNGTVVYPDGSSQTVHILFRFLLQPSSPPRIFFVKVTCGG